MCQLVSRESPSRLYISGEAHENIEIKVENQPSSRRGRRFFSEVSVDNSIDAVMKDIEILGIYKGDTLTKTTKDFVKKDPEIFAYDDDGNLTQDGQWNYTWNAENRLIRIETRNDIPALNSVKKRLDFSYDYKGRRVQKIVYYEDSGNWVKDYEKRFLYDQWNLIAELDENLNLIKTFTWGTDISGTEQGAGGVGGLLSMTVHTTGKTYFYCHDGNGNVVGLVDSSSGAVVQEYEYSPFGELLRGGEDVVNPFKFSGKYMDFESELIYYTFRYYSPEMERWLNRDPIGERGGVNIYGFVGNDGIGEVDKLGLIDIIQVCSCGWKGYKGSRGGCQHCHMKLVYSVILFHYQHLL